MADPVIVTVPLDQEALIEFTPKDRAGNPGRVDGRPTWTPENQDDVYTVNDPNHPHRAWVGKNTEENPSDVNVEADADLGEGVRAIAAKFTVTGGPALTVSGDVTVIETRARTIPLPAPPPPEGPPA